MADVTKIEWTDATWNAWWGCQSVGPGCDHCYAEALDKRTGGAHWGARATRRRTSDTNWNAPLKWQRAAAKFEAQYGRHRRVFCGSMMDIMDNAVPIEWSHEAFARIEECDRIDWQLLTKRVGNVSKRVPDHWTSRNGWPRHVGLMVTVVNQEEASRDIPKLLDLKAEYGIPWVGLSCEPLLGPIDLSRAHGVNDLPTGFLPVDFGAVTMIEGIDWVIAGGESGPHARPSSIQWYRSLRDQCAAAGVPFLFKQWGEWHPAGAVRSETPGRFAYGDYEHDPSHMILTDHYPRQFTMFGARSVVCRIGKKAAGRLLDGIEHNGFPEAAAA